MMSDTTDTLMTSCLSPNCVIVLICSSAALSAQTAGRHIRESGRINNHAVRGHGHSFPRRRLVQGMAITARALDRDRHSTPVTNIWDPLNINRYSIDLFESSDD